MEVSLSRNAIVDGHVHLHRCFDIADALDAAACNLRNVRSLLGLHPNTAAFLWLVEHDEEGSSDRLNAVVASGERWRLKESAGPCLHLSRPEDGVELNLVLGQQVRSTEDLEILVVGGAVPTSSGLTLLESIEASLGPDTLIMVPWGFGKWTGARGRLVMQAYQEYADQGLRLADTGARTGYRAALPAFALSQKEGRPVLAGSDPFPFQNQLHAIGKAGFVVENLTSGVDWPGLLNAIKSLRGQPRRFGSPRGLLEFVSLQGRMQLRKRLGGGHRGR